MSQQCITGCGRETNNPDGICTICRMDGVTSVIKDPRPINKKTIKGKSKRKYKKCEHENCNNRNFLKGLCYKHFIEIYGKDALPESMKPKSRKENKNEHHGNEGGELQEPAEKRGWNPAVHNNDKTAFLAQLLYVSDLLDNQLNSALEAGKIDIKVILDIRNRLGVVLRTSMPAVEATA